MTKNLDKMDLKQILITGMFLLSGTSLSAEGIPKVNQEQLMYELRRTYPNGQISITRVYDTDGDGQRDTKLHYIIIPPSKDEYLDSFAIDENGDNKFTKNEWRFRLHPLDKKTQDNAPREV